MLAVAGMLAAGLLAGCTSQEGEEARGLLFGSPSSSDAAPGASAEADPTSSLAPEVAGSIALPESCTELVRPGRVVSVLGVRLPGETTYVYAGPLPDVGRTGRVTCAYGVPKQGKNPQPAVEISLNAYQSDELAGERMAVTRDAAAQGGQQITEAPLQGREGFLLADRDGVSYVVADGQLTAVITVERGLVPERVEQAALEQLALDVLDVQRT